MNLLNKRSLAICMIATGIIWNAGGMSSASADDLYGSTEEKGKPIEHVTVKKGTGVTADEKDATNTGAEFTVEKDAKFGYVYGGYTRDEWGLLEVKSNKVTVNGGEISDDVIGGFSNSNEGLESFGGSAQANKNTVIVTAGTISSVIVGGRSNGYNEATTEGNTVTMSGGETSLGVSGGFSNSNKGLAIANGNTVTINGGKISNSLSGGFSESFGGSTQANNNTVIVTAGTIPSFIVGGYSNGYNEATANGNTVNVTGGNISSYCDVFGGFILPSSNEDRSVIASENIVTIDGVTVYLCEGGAAQGGFKSATAYKNKVTIKGNAAVTTSVFGGEADANDKATVTGNIVIIDSGEISNNVYGGYGMSGESVTVNENAVIINNGKISGNVYGGYAISSKPATMKDNTVTLGNGKDSKGIATITGDVQINSAAINAAYGTATEGGTLNVYNAGNTVGSLHTPGATMNFYINSADMDQTGSKTMLAVTGDADIHGSTVNAGIRNVGYVEKGYKINLLTAGGALNATDVNTHVMTDADVKGVLTDGLLEADLSIAVDNTSKKIIATVGKDTPKPEPTSDPTPEPTPASEPEPTPESTPDLTPAPSSNIIPAPDPTPAPESNIIPAPDLTPAPESDITPEAAPKEPAAVRVTEKAKSPVETQISGMSIINSASDMIEMQAFGDAAEAVNNYGNDGKSDDPANSNTGNMAVFTSMKGGNIRQESGSHVTTHAWNMILGLAKKIKNKNGDLLFGPIIEYGRGSYDSYLDDGTHGNGDSSFWGGGLIAKQANDNGFYYEGSIRAGRVKNNYHSFDAGEYKQYDNSATYYAMHIGIGKTVGLKKGDTLDYYGKLFYTHQNSSSGVMNTGHIYEFAAVNSVRTKLGFRYNHHFKNKNDIYAGLAWQHEFKGTANATIHAGDYGLSTPAPSIKGDTGVMELGWRTSPSKNDNFTMGIGVNGYIGKQRGVSADLKLQWKF